MNSSYTRSKNTKRFNFSLNRDRTSHKAGANSVTISYRDIIDNDETGTGTGISTDTTKLDTGRRGSYSFGGFDSGSTVTMSVKEAKALNHFLTSHLS